MEIKKKIGQLRRILSEIEMEVLKEPQTNETLTFIKSLQKSNHEVQKAHLDYRKAKGEN